MTKTLNEFLAGLMGWEWVEREHDVTKKTTMNFFNMWKKKDGTLFPAHQWNPDTDHNDAAKVVAKIGENGAMKPKVLEALSAAMVADGGLDSLWGILTATPSQKMRAAYKAIEGKEWPGDD